MPLDDYTHHQQGIIKRYYRNQNSIQVQRLSELATELYLAEGKKRENLWKQVSSLLKKLNVPESRIEHVLNRRDPALLPGLVRELENS